MRWDQLNGGLETDALFGVKRRIRRILWSQDQRKKAVDAPFLDDSLRIPEIERLVGGAEWIRTGSTVSALPDDNSQCASSSDRKLFECLVCGEKFPRADLVCYRELGLCRPTDSQTRRR